MADDVTTPVPDGTKLAFDEVTIGGVAVKVGRNKIGHGADGEYSEVSEASPLPVALPAAAEIAVVGPLTNAQLRSAALPVEMTFPGTQTVDGTVSISGAVAVTGNFYQATQPVSAVSLPLPEDAATATKQDEAKAAFDKLASAKSWFAIAPADTALATVPDAIYVGGPGNLVLRGDDAADATFAVVAGQILPVSPAQVRAATTATDLVGLVA